MNEKEIVVDFLYLDLSICERCIATGDTLDEAVQILTPVFETLGYSVKVNKVNVNTEELAEKHCFISSPTIRVNGIDICTELKESECENCGDLCGDSVDCRVFIYEGKEYAQPPTAAIVDGILKALFGNTQNKTATYGLPQNLKKYFIGREKIMKTMKIYEPAMCCPTGLCGINSNNPDLLRLAAVLDNLNKNGVKIERYNLTGAPQAFITNAEVNKAINEKGTDVLPIIMIDDKIEITGRYPTNEEIVNLMGIKAELLEAPKSGGGCGCGSKGCC